MKIRSAAWRPILIVILAAGVIPAATAQILTTEFSNPSYATDKATWSSDVCGGQTFLHNRTPYFEWTPIFGGEYDTPLVGLSGTILADPTYSGLDLPFTHPFGTDWEFFIVPDQSYASVLAPSNGCTSFTQTGACVNNIDFGNTANAECTAAGVPHDCCTGAGSGSCNVDQEYRDALTAAHGEQVMLPSSPLGVQGIIGVETDQGLIPPEFRNKVHNGAIFGVHKGDRVAIFGRWITDCGHPDFHTEIHPPLLMAVGRQQTGSSGQPVTSTEVISRPYLVSQTFEDGEGTRHHLYDEMLKGLAIPDCFPVDDIVSSLLGENGGCKVTECPLGVCVDTYCLLPALWFNVPCTTRFEAHPNFEPKPFQGLQTMTYLVKPPVPRQCAARKLLVSAHFTVRHGVTATVEPYPTDAAKVTITMDDSQYTAPPLPPKADMNLSLDDLKFLNKDTADEIETIRDVLLAATPVFAEYTPVSPAIGTLFTALLDQGVLTDCYDPSYGSFFPNHSFPDCAALKPLAASSPADSQNAVVATPIDELSGPVYAEDNSDSQVFPVYGTTQLEWSQEEYPPKITITQPTSMQYLHTETITLNYSAADTGCGVGSETATMDGAPTLLDGHSLASGQTINLLTEMTIGNHTFAVTAADNVGDTNSASATFTIIVTPASIMTDVTQLLQSGAIKNQGLATSLLAKLQAAATARSSGQCSTAADIYQAFINELMAQSAKGVGATASAIMIADAQYLMTHCP
jgi:FIMAH domain